MTTRFRTSQIFVVCIIVMVFGGLIFPIQIATASTIWEDNFEDQDLHNWEVTRGVFSAEQKTLWAYGTEAATSNRAYHESNVTVGSFSFDILLKQNWIWRFHPPAIRFMVDSRDDIVWNGYVLDFYTLNRVDGPILAVYLRVRADTWDYLSHFEYDRPAHGWQSVNIVRTSSGRLSVYLNETMIIDTTDNRITNSSYFVFDAEDCVQTVYDPDTHTDSFVEARESPMLDNIVVTEISELVDSKYSPFLTVIIVLMGWIALVVIGKDEIRKRRL
ncbi:MAG: hypothetical protein RTU63_10095 [Candidatus Thorarchaeota archaeon]